jgi:hypothetical protein
VLRQKQQQKRARRKGGWVGGSRSATSEVLEQGEVGEAVGEHAADAVDVDDRLV